ncbi:GNAT family N-acetyltransferase [Alteribacillus sp. HJP-4]|uniref:GNAT family N-acetyltransferase n=1 Tax=Alteribacillus sp. HJP-4 TaxID=2775394 RepID=UPI0035CD1669
MNILIQLMETPHQLEQVRKLEAAIWGRDESVPIHQTSTAVKNGGFVLGAFIHDELVGFQYSFPGFDGNIPYLCSHTLGIKKEFRKMGVGRKLKLAQKEMALRKNYELITWTYDPLETVNGYLNLHKLGAVCSTYLNDAYGELADGLNDGLASDRFLVSWSIQNEKRVSRIDSIETINCAFQVSIRNGFLFPNQVQAKVHDNLVLVPVPGNFQQMKRESMSIAKEWRNRCRSVFTSYFDEGWEATDLRRDNKNNNLFYYLLEKRR